MKKLVTSLVLLSCVLQGCNTAPITKQVLSDPGTLTIKDKQILLTMAAASPESFQRQLPPHGTAGKRIFLALRKLQSIEREQPFVPAGTYQATLLCATTNTVSALSPKLWFLIHQKPIPVIMCYGDRTQIVQYPVGSRLNINITQLSLDPLSYRVTDCSLSDDIAQPAPAGDVLKAAPEE